MTDLVANAYWSQPNIFQNAYYYLIFNGSAGAVVNSITVDVSCFVSNCPFALDVLDTVADGAYFKASTSLNLTIPVINATNGRITFSVQNSCGTGPWVLPSSGPFALKLSPPRGDLIFWQSFGQPEVPFNTTNGFAYVNWAYDFVGNMTYGTDYHRQVEISYIPPPSPPPPPPSPSPPPPSPSPPPPSPSPPPPPSPSPPPPKPSPPPPKPSPPPPKPSPPPRRPPPPPPVVKEGGAFSDDAGLHFTGFNGEPVSVSPTAGAWLEVIGSTAQKFSLQAQFGASINDRRKLVTRATSLRVGNNTVVVRVALSAASKRWELSAAANGKAVGGASTTLAGGVKVGVARFSPPSNLVTSRVVIDAGFVKLVVTQRWDPRASHPQDSVNFGVTLLGPLKLPVSGALKASYTAAFRRARATAAGARSVVLSAASGQQP